MRPIDKLLLRHTKEQDQLNIRHRREITQLQMKCLHVYGDNKTSIKEAGFIGDSWHQCDQCCLQFKSDDPILTQEIVKDKPKGCSLCGRELKTEEEKLLKMCTPHLDEFDDRAYGR